tara:strand:+ start:22 stop:735 length:714 start_codon:yes stop_codon:yes gene_type:complete
MPLPKISTPTYDLTIPSSNRKIKYRPFLVKEEKILIIAMETQDDKQIAEAVKNVLGSCILTKGISVDKLSTFDIEYLFLNIRGKSVGETVEVLVTCPDDNTTKVPVTVNLDEIQVKRSDEHDIDINLDGKLSMRMKYPSMGEFVKNNFNVEMKVEDTFDMVCSCIEQVFSEDESWAASDCTKKELLDFLESLDSNQFKKIEKFFDTMPKLSHTIKVTNPKTKIESDVVLEGLNAFFV